MGIVFRRINPAISAVALIAGLFHHLNHAHFKSLLFLNAGSILYVIVEPVLFISLITAAVHARSLGIYDLFLPDLGVTLGKVLLVVLVVATIDAVNPRLRIDQAIVYFFGVIIVSLAGLALALVGS